MLEVPQLVIRASIAFQRNGVVVLSTSECSNSAVALKFDPSDPISITINGEDLLNELEASLVLVDNVPEGGIIPNSNIVTVFIKVLSCQAILDSVTVPVIALDEPLKNEISRRRGD